MGTTRNCNTPEAHLRAALSLLAEKNRRYLDVDRVSFDELLGISIIKLIEEYKLCDRHSQIDERLKRSSIELDVSTTGTARSHTLSTIVNLDRLIAGQSPLSFRNHPWNIDAVVMGGR
jgi:hypothetical protein